MPEGGVWACGERTQTQALAVLNVTANKPRGREFVSFPCESEAGHCWKKTDYVLGQMYLR